MWCLISLSTSAPYFDLNANGFAESTGWINAQDGFLVADLNNNQKIDDGRELFGNNTLLKDGSLAANGFDALKEWDSNGDGLISELDEGWGQLKVWQDKNLDGQTDEGELIGLDEAGIKHLDLNYMQQNVTDASGNNHLQTGEVGWKDGGSSSAVDVWFQVDPTSSINLEIVDISEEVRLLPNIQAFGNVADLHTAMQKNEVLREKVEAFLASDFSTQKNLLNELIYEWTGSIDVDPYSRDPSKIYKHVMDARQLVALENLIGRGYMGTWCWGEKDPNPHGQAAPILIDEFYKFANYAHAALLAKSKYSAEFNGLVLVQFNDQGKLVYDETQLIQTLKNLVDSGNLAEVRTLISVARGLGNYDALLRVRINAVFEQVSSMGVAYRDALEGQSLGSTANDVIRGTNLDDTLVGYGGNDVLNGGAGNDTYLFDKGFDRDQIYDSSGTDRILFGVGIVLADLRFSRDLTSLYITRVGQDGNPTYDRIEIRNFFDMDGSIGHGSIESLVFGDGSVVSDADLFEFARPRGTEGDDALYLSAGNDEINALGGNDVIYAGSGDDIVHGGAGDDEIRGDHGNDELFGDEGNDKLYGGNGDDVLIGGEGNDQLYGENGNDVLIGGASNDYLQGGAGSDTYVFGKNFGQDTIDNWDSSAGRNDVIQFTEGWKASDFTYRRSGDDLVISSINSNDSIRIVDHFDGYNDQIDLITFDDGTQLTVEDIKRLTLIATEKNDELHGDDAADVLNGLGGDDKLYGGKGNDILIGGKGNDYLYGEAGSDTYYFEKEWGNDVIDAYYDNKAEDKDIIKFGEGIHASNLILRFATVRLDIYDVPALQIALKNGTDTINIAGFYTRTC